MGKPLETASVEMAGCTHQLTMSKLDPVKPFFADQVVELKPSEMEPFYAQDKLIQSQHAAIESLMAKYDSFCAEIDVKIQELIDTKVNCHHIISANRQKTKACARRIANWEEKKKRSRYHPLIRQRRAAIEVRKTTLNRRYATKTASSMVKKMFNRLKTSAAVHIRDLPKPAYYPPRTDGKDV